MSDLHLGDTGRLPGIGLEEAVAFREALLVTVVEQKVVTAAALFAAGHPHQTGSDLMAATLGMGLGLRSRDHYLQARVPRDQGPGLDHDPLLIPRLQN